MSRRVVNQLLAMPERELFLRATRAYVGHRQVGVDYVRPERMFGRSTNNLLKNFGWATKGILTVSRAPLAALSLIGVSLFGLSVVALLAQIVVRIVRPDLSPPGVVSVLLVSTFFGSINLLAISVVGGYVGRILEESKNRPRFIAEYITRNGRSETFDAIDTDR
jgi:dolichol-phosphate mannosyltransferase